MHPIDPYHYPTIQRGLEELRRQAEQERLIRAAKLRKVINLRNPVWMKGNLRRSIAWVGIHLARLGQKLMHAGIARETLHSPPASPHH